MTTITKTHTHTHTHTKHVQDRNLKELKTIYITSTNAWLLKQLQILNTRPSQF